MKRVEPYARVRHPVMIDGLSQREAARRFGIEAKVDWSQRSTISRFSSSKLSSSSSGSKINGTFGKDIGSYCVWLDHAVL